MNKFLIGAVIGGIIAYVGHRQVVKAANGYAKAVENITVPN
jgi:hypothetical protein